MSVATQTATTAGKEASPLCSDESLGAAAGLEGTVIKGFGDRRRERHGADPMSAQNPKAASL